LADGSDVSEGKEMTNEQTMKLMEELGLHDGGVDNWYSDNAWVKFARLVAEHEREACAALCDVLAVHPEYASDVTKLAALAIRARGQV
jgi:hypothetical protein